ncbi:hypothetical protein CPLU01_09895 [Colletotrichum plurivorum]|uniref:Uncharacterized protein n=1 Tax=Colletotrichum plurivorum TaxID=2175906 RepID=A0A8H6K6Q8_9PEZI|nr:hypothetical protein CPLU01_09895 [Colletotrichum plurivorum]
MFTDNPLGTLAHLARDLNQVPVVLRAPAQGNIEAAHLTRHEQRTHAASSESRGAQLDLRVCGLPDSVPVGVTGQ